MIELLKQYNNLFMQNYSHGDESADEIFRFTDCKSKLILSAPHATRSFVAKQVKIADLYIGALVKYVGEITNTSTLIRVKYTPYKALLSDYVAEHDLQDHYFLDMHGFNKDIGYDVCLGIGDMDKDGYPKLDSITELCVKYGLRYIVNHDNYTGRKGFTGRYQRAFGKSNIIQMELRQFLRNFYQYPDIVENTTVPFLQDVIRCY